MNVHVVEEKKTQPERKQPRVSVFDGSTVNVTSSHLSLVVLNLGRSVGHLATHETIHHVKLVKFYGYFSRLYEK